jgi:hypothetical protein
MEKIILYCKSYHKDIDRILNLVNSINLYNTDKLPFYISVPESDVELFTQKQFPNTHIISDERINKNPDLYKRGINPRVLAFSTRLNIWMSELAENYFCLDSDAYFIRPFSIKDFMFDDETPYTVMHEQKELFTWTVTKTKELGFDPKEGFMGDRNLIMSIFGRQGRLYDFGPNPVILNSKVLESLNKQYLIPNNLTTEDLIEVSSDEYTWYGEALLAFEPIKIRPTESLFKVFHYPQQYVEYKQQNVTEEMIAQNYMGIIMQSNFNGPINY